jgi:hypothetical protein
MLLSSARHSTHYFARCFQSSPKRCVPIYATISRRNYHLSASMCAANGMGEPTPVSLPNSQQFYLDSEQGLKYLIQLSWPLHWQDIDTTERNPVPVM